jgi:hypothetical protein
MPRPRASWWGPPPQNPPPPPDAAVKQLHDGSRILCQISMHALLAPLVQLQPGTKLNSIWVAGGADDTQAASGYVPGGPCQHMCWTAFEPSTAEGSGTCAAAAPAALACVDNCMSHAARGSTSRADVLACRCLLSQHSKCVRSTAIVLTRSLHICLCLLSDCAAVGSRERAWWPPTGACSCCCCFCCCERNSTGTMSSIDVKWQPCSRTCQPGFSLPYDSLMSAQSMPHRLQGQHQC